jgi:hypothetical protein
VPWWSLLSRLGSLESRPDAAPTEAEKDSAPPIPSSVFSVDPLCSLRHHLKPSAADERRLLPKADYDYDYDCDYEGGLRL